MLVGIAVGLYTAFSLPLAIPAAGAVTVAVMGHAMFVDGPVDSPADLTDEETR
jgi:hypothetical protein